MKRPWNPRFRGCWQTPLCLPLTACPTSRTMGASCQGELPCRPNIPAMPDHPPETAAKTVRPPAPIKRNSLRTRARIMPPVLIAGLPMDQMAVLVRGQIHGQVRSRTPVRPETAFRNANLRSPRPSNLTPIILQALPHPQNLSPMLTPMPLTAYALTRP